MCDCLRSAPAGSTTFFGPITFLAVGLILGGVGAGGLGGATGAALGLGGSIYEGACMIELFLYSSSSSAITPKFASFGAAGI